MNDLLARSPFDPGTERKVVIIADWLPPDFGAVGQYMQLRARALGEKGHEVTLVGLSSREHASERAMVGEGSLTEIRLRSAPVPRHSLLRRLLWTLATDWRLVWAAFPHLRAANGILFTGSPPFLIHLLAPLRFLWAGRLVYRITDFHPECVIAAQQRTSLALGLLLGLTNFWRRRIDAFEVLGEDQRLRLRESGVDGARISLVRDGSPVAFRADTPVEPRPASLAGSCVLLYSGNYGVAHDVETVAAGYELHHRRGTGRVRLWLSAAGEGAELLADRLARAGLPYHRSQPVPLERLAGLLLAADAHLITLKDRFVGFVMPSKVYACLDSGKPLVFVGNARSDVDLLARRRGNSYWRVACGDDKAFAAALEALAEGSATTTT